MEQQVRDLLEEYAGDRSSILEQIEGSWNKQTRRPSAGEIDDWIAAEQRALDAAPARAGPRVRPQLTLSLLPKSSS